MTQAPSIDPRSLREQLAQREQELARLNDELVDTNRGVVALYAELDDAAQRLRSADAMKSRFLSNVSHEFKTPLASIRALAALLLSGADGELGTEQSRQVRLIREAADGLSELVRDLLDIARIEAGKSELKLAPVAIDELFSGLRGMFKPMVPPEVKLVVDDGCAERIVSDEGKLTQVLRNLLSNALKFTVAGEVRLACRGDGTSHLVFEVTDTGIGIADEDQALIFEEFVQIRNPLQSGAQGTGLGLPLCRRLAELLGGEITLASAPGSGSRFALRLPRVHPEADDAAAES